ncbi:MAG: hypothetical protein A3H44_06400 [Gammaproteobacteria bacterium RIFCSPLOWO2_02_FULL_57_10]|nr:MAG: hypothetical protein A3H44_06400 [Gammaproteobacteria bacterium RIFCSPLOWO2_02_FULL_57_10]
MSEPQIRILTSSDWQLYKSIRLQSLLDSPDSFGSTYAREVLLTDVEWRARLETSARTIDSLPLIVELNEEPVALAWGLIHQNSENLAHIYQMWVRPESRGQGIAKALLSQIVQWAHNSGCAEVALAVTTINESAMHLYLKSGFEPSGVTEELRAGSELRVQPLLLKLPGDPRNQSADR